MASSSAVTPIAVHLPPDALAGAVVAQTPAAVQSPSDARIRNGNHAPVPQSAAETSVAVGELVEALKATSISLRFEIDESTNRVVTKVVDKETGELIRQMPTVEVLRIARAIDKLQGLFVSHAA